MQAVRFGAHAQVNKQQVLVGTKPSEYSDGAQEGADCQEVGDLGFSGVGSLLYCCAYDSSTKKALLGSVEVGLRLNVSST